MHYKLILTYLMSSTVLISSPVLANDYYEQIIVENGESRSFNNEDTIHNDGSNFALSVTGDGSNAEINGSTIDITGDKGGGAVSVLNKGIVNYKNGQIRSESSYGEIVRVYDQGSKAYLDNIKIDIGKNSLLSAYAGGLLSIYNSEITFSESDLHFGMYVYGKNSYMEVKDTLIKGGRFLISGGGNALLNNVTSHSVGGTMRIFGNPNTSTYSSAKIIGGSFDTVGGYGVDINHFGSLSVDNSSFNVRNGLSGFWLAEDTSRLNLLNSSVDTWSDNYGHGVDVWGGEAHVTEGKITTHGNNSYGLKVTGSTNSKSSILEVDKTKINVLGKRGGGVFIGGLTAEASLDNVTIHGEGEEAFGIVQMNTAKLTKAINLDIRMTGENGGAYLSYISRNTADAWNRATFENSYIEAGKGTAFWLQGKNHALSLNDSKVTVDDDGGYLLRVSDTILTNGTKISTNHIDFTADNSVLSGDVIINSTTADVHVSLRNNTQFTGKLREDSDSPVAQLSLEGSSTWNVTGNSKATNLSVDNSLVNFMHSDGGAFTPTTLTVNGNYVGNNGTIDMSTVLGDDTSLTDKLVIEGDTSGTSNVQITNAGGTGALTTKGIEIITVGGKSDGTFTLKQESGADYVVAGAYTYRLHKDNADGTAPNDWYLRSQIEHGPKPKPEYHQGATVYEVYPQALLGLNGVSTLQQRVGNRFWSGAGNQVIAQGADAITPYAPPEEAGTHVEGNGVWGRIEGAFSHVEPRFSTTRTNFNQNTLKMQAGIDGLSIENERGTLIGGVFVQYVHGKTKTNTGSLYADGEISTDGYGFGGTLTWYGNEGFYIDSQAQATWYRSDLTTNAIGAPTLADGNKGFGYALSAEAGKRIAIDTEWSVTPQAQLVYSSVKFDDFRDGFGSNVAFDKGDSLQGRLGLTLDHETSWQNANGLLNRSHVYGIANLYYEFLEGTRVHIEDAANGNVSFASQKDRVWGGIGLGGSYNWDDDKYSIYGEGIFNTSLNNFGDSYSVKGNVGFRVKW